MPEESTPFTLYYVYRDKQNEWRWRLLTSGLRILAISSEGYTAREDCLASVEQVKSSGKADVLIDDHDQGLGKD